MVDDHSSFDDHCSRCLRFEGCLLPTAILRSLHRCSMGFRSGLIDLDSTFWHWALRCASKLFGSLQIPWCHAHSQDIWCQKQQSNPKHLWTSTMFDRRDRVLFFEGLISFSVNSTIICSTKKLYFGLICPHEVLPEGFSLPQVSFGKL